MSQTHAHPEKKHDEKHNHAGETIEQQAAPAVEADPVPAPEDGGHAHSHAAHLDESATPHTKPAGNLRQGSAPGALREPPMEVSRAGKQHRRQ